MFDREHYLDCIVFEYVPDIAVAHFHGRKTPDVGGKLMQNIWQQSGALMVKHRLERDTRTSGLEVPG
jgi:hypothetical protein